MPGCSFTVRKPGVGGLVDGGDSQYCWKCRATMSRLKCIAWVVFCEETFQACSISCSSCQNGSSGLSGSSGLYSWSEMRSRAGFSSSVDCRSLAMYCKICCCRVACTSAVPNSARIAARLVHVGRHREDRRGLASMELSRLNCDSVGFQNGSAHNTVARGIAITS